MEPSTSSPCSSPASGRKQTKIVSLFTQLMTPTPIPTPSKKEEGEPVSLLGEEVDKLRKIIALHEGLMREASTPMKPPTAEQPPCTPARMEMKENKIVTNLLNAFEQQADTSRHTPTSSSTTPPVTTTATPFKTPAPMNPSSRPASVVAPRAIPVPLTPAIQQQTIPLYFSTPIPPPQFTPRANPTPLTFATPLPPTPPSSIAVLPPTTPAQLVPCTPMSAMTSNVLDSPDSDTTYSFSEVDLDSSHEVEEAIAARIKEENVEMPEAKKVEVVPTEFVLLVVKDEPVTKLAVVEPIEVKQEDAKVEEAKVEEAKVEEAKVEEAKVEEAKVEEAKEEPNVEEPKVEVDIKAEALQSLTQQYEEALKREEALFQTNKLMKGLIVRKDLEIRDLGKKVKEFDQVEAIRVQGEAQLADMKRERESLLELVVSKDAIIEEKASESLKLSTQIKERYKPIEERLTQTNLERRQLFNQVMELKGNIRVFCRVRPLTSSETTSGEKMVSTFPVEGSIMIQNKKYDFDRVFEPSVGQSAVFEEVKPLIGSVMDGYNVCLFCYGQTGSGKTFTMEGTDSERGIYYRALDELFQSTQLRSALQKSSVSVSVMEIYNENVRDLLCSDPSKKLEIRTGSNGVMVPDLTAHEVLNMDQVLSLMAYGASNRAVGATNQNEHSSRSHCIVCVTVSAENLSTRITTIARLHLVDLAGSERLSKTNAEGDRLKEAQHINKSLSALGEVVNHLVAKNSHVPYRNSKLTHLLMDCLGGDSKTLMFVHINPAESSAGESVCSLNFAARARSVENGPAKKHTDAEQVKLSSQLKKKDDVIFSQQALIDQLKTQLKAAEDRIVKADERYKNLLLHKESQTPKQEKPFAEITNIAAPPVIPATNYVSILRENPSTPRKIDGSKADAPAKGVTFDLSAASKENVENGEERTHTNTRVRFAEELKTAPQAKRMKVEPTSSTTAPTVPAAPTTLPLRPSSTLAPRMATRSTTKIEPVSPMKSASWNNSLRGGSKVPSLPPPKRAVRQLATSTSTSSFSSSSLPQRSKRV